MFKGRPCGQSVILLCVRWCLAYNLSLRVAQPKLARLGIVPVQ
jgi:transposase-like protein